MAAAAPLPAPLARPEDLANLATQSIAVSDSGGSDNDLSFASFVSVASLEADIVDEGAHLQEPPPRPGPVTRERTGRAGPKRRYDESESSTDPAPPKKKPAREEPQRRGKWTAPEEAYANGIIDLFVASKFPGCSGGESLRALLSKLLLCSPMRITKKFSRTRLIGKSSYKEQGEPSIEELATLEGARRAFRRHADLPEESEGGKERLDAWVTTQGFDPSQLAAGEHSLCGGGFDPTQLPPAVTPPQTDPSQSASWSLFNRQQSEQPAQPAAVTSYAKDGKAFVRVVARNDADFLLVLAQQLAVHGVVVANLRCNAEAGVAWARVEVCAANSGAPLDAVTLKALEASFLIALRAKNTEADRSRANASAPMPTLPQMHLPHDALYAPPPAPPGAAPPPPTFLSGAFSHPDFRDFRPLSEEEQRCVLAPHCGP